MQGSSLCRALGGHASSGSASVGRRCRANAATEMPRSAMEARNTSACEFQRGSRIGLQKGLNYRRFISVFSGGFDFPV